MLGKRFSGVVQRRRDVLVLEVGMLIDDVVGMGMGTNCGPMVRPRPTIQALWFLFALVAALCF